MSEETNTEILVERYPIGMTFFSTSDHLEVEDVPFVVARDNPTRSEALKYYRRVATHFGLDVRQYETVDSVERSNGSFRVEAQHLAGTTRSYRAHAIVVATGYFDTPNLLEVPGEDLPKVTHYFRDPHLYFNQDVLVVGGGNSAVEAALSTWRAGARVTLAQPEALNHLSLLFRRNQRLSPSPSRFRRPPFSSVLRPSVALACRPSPALRRPVSPISRSHALPPHRRLDRHPATSADDGDDERAETGSPSARRASQHAAHLRANPTCCPREFERPRV